MDTESLRLLSERRAALWAKLEQLRADSRPVEEELAQVDRGLAAMRGQSALSPNGAGASRDAVAYYARDAHPEAQHLTIKQLVIKALRDHLTNGATSNELLDFFAREWGRNDIMRTSLSPQLTRLKEAGEIELRGKVWHFREGVIAQIEKFVAAITPPQNPPNAAEAFAVVPILPPGASRERPSDDIADLL